MSPGDERKDGIRVGRFNRLLLTFLVFVPFPLLLFFAILEWALWNIACPPLTITFGRYGSGVSTAFGILFLIACPIVVAVGWETIAEQHFGWALRRRFVRIASTGLILFASGVLFYANGMLSFYCVSLNGIVMHRGVFQSVQRYDLNSIATISASCTKTLVHDDGKSTHYSSYSVVSYRLIFKDGQSIDIGSPAAAEDRLWKHISDLGNALRYVKFNYNHTHIERCAARWRPILSHPLGETL